MKKFLSYIPHRLVILHRPALVNFPLNVLLVDDQGKTSRYEADLSTFKNGFIEQSLLYRSLTDRRYSLKFIINHQAGKQYCEKYCEEELLGVASGIVDKGKLDESWQRFFIQVGVLGRMG